MIVADDHPVALAGLEGILRRAGCEVVARARTGREALRLIRELGPDVAVVDVALPELSGLEVARRARKLGVPVVLISMYEEEALVREAATTGAAAYVTKMAPPQEIADTVKAVAEGEVFLADDFRSPYTAHRSSP
ncbi:MAG: response regulator transcription factor, partial [Caldiserica bacterium]|nr:response regulator transcription factor [Caldisericota bacterium]